MYKLQTLKSVKRESVFKKLWNSHLSTNFIHLPTHNNIKYDVKLHVITLILLFTYFEYCDTKSKI